MVLILKNVKKVFYVFYVFYEFLCVLGYFKFSVQKNWLKIVGISSKSSRLKNDRIE